MAAPWTPQILPSPFREYDEHHQVIARLWSGPMASPWCKAMCLGSYRLRQCRCFPTLGFLSRHCPAMATELWSVIADFAMCRNARDARAMLSTWTPAACPGFFTRGCCRPIPTLGVPGHQPT
mmetsp:Transcript_7732/g.22130  ORF Transcript_7732/g.22130 Transcript_7732/m.22130 type:complete len:122 (+) Transcript_7732:99-464(+)